MVASEQGQTATTAAGLQKLGGSRKPDVNLLLANQAMHSLWMPNQDLDAMWGVTLGLMRDIAPTDALEGMLTAQLVATHNLHMRCHRLAAETESPEKLKDYGNMAAKAGRSFCGLMTTLSRHRGKAPAQVKIEQVNVDEDGQAIVVVNKSGEATAAHAPATTSGTVADEPTMRSAHPEPNALQIATGSGKDPLPDARRGDGERSADREQECPEAWPLHGGSDCVEVGVSSADAPEPTIDRQPVSVADLPVAALVDGGNLPEWSSAPLAGPAGPAYFPSMGLDSTIQRINDLYKRTRAQRVPVSLDDATAAWTAAGWDGLPVAAALDQIDALLTFGFVEQSGEGSERRIRISEVGHRFIKDDDQSSQILAAAAMKPKLVAEYIGRWGRYRPTDDVCIPELKTAHRFSDKEAKLFLRVYDGTALFACKKDPLEVPEPLPQFDGQRGRQKPLQDFLTTLTPEIDGFLNICSEAGFDPEEPDEDLLDSSEHRDPQSSDAMCPA